MASDMVTMLGNCGCASHIVWMPPGRKASCVQNVYRRQRRMLLICRNDLFSYRSCLTIISICISLCKNTSICITAYDPYNSPIMEVVLTFLKRKSPFTCFKGFIYFREGKGGRKRGRETSVCGCLSQAPNRGPGP